MTTRLTLSLDDPRWTAFVGRCRHATPFHDPAWASLLAETYRYPAFACAVQGVDGEIVGGAPFLEVRSLSRRRRWISLPFTDECAPLAADADSLSELSEALGDAQAAGEAPGVEVRGAVHGLGWTMGADAVTHQLWLEPDLASLRRRFSRSQVVRNIARAERDGVAVRRAETVQDLEAFYQLHTRTRRRQGVPVQPRRFFTLLWSRLVQSGLAFILLADIPDRPAVAGALFLSDGRTTIYKFGASDVDSLRFRPNHLIFWTAIGEAAQAGHRIFDFGRTDLANEGLRAFKSGWGAEERPLLYSTLEPGAAAGEEGIAARALSLAIRKGPAWMCRGTGEALYRYAGSR